jgi:hypothetical protein
MLALKWEPSHPYAAVNLMRAMALRGSVKEARMIAESLADAKYLDAWGASEVERILQMPEEKPKSETLDRSAPPE